MLLELQLESQAIITMIRNQVKAARTPIANPISFEINKDDIIDVYVDHIGIDATTLRPSIDRYPIAGSGAFQVPVLEIQQDLTAYVVTGGELKLHNQAPFPHGAFLVAKVSIIGHVQIGIGNNGPELCLSITDVKADALDADQLAVLKQMVDISKCMPLDMAALTNYMQGLNLANAGIAISNDGKRIAARFEVGTAFQTADQWLHFMDGTFDDLLFGRKWAIFVDGDIIGNTAVNQLAGGFDYNKMGLQDGPFSEWQPIGVAPLSIPRTVVTFSGWIRDACTTIIGILDLSFDATVTMTVSVPEEDLLQIDIVADWSGDKGTEFFCAFSNIAFGAITSIFAKLQGNGWIGMAMAINPAGPLGNLIAVIVVFNSGLLDSLLPSPPQLTKVGDLHYQMYVPFNAPDSLPVNNMHLEAAFATHKGLVISGTFDDVPELPDPVLSIEPWSDQKFAWYNDDPCHQSVPVLELKLYLKPSPYPLLIAPPIVLNDPSGQYAASIVEWDNDGIRLVLSYLRPGFAPGYECDLVLLTTGGARYLHFPQPESLQPFKDQQDELNYGVQLTGWRAGNCWKATSIWNLIGEYNPKWSVDPGPEGSGEGIGDLHVWTAVVTDLGPRESVSLIGASGQVLGEATAGARGRVQLDAAIVPSTGDTEVTLSRNGAKVPYADYVKACRQLAQHEVTSTTSGILATTQVQLGRMATLPVGAAITSLLLTQNGGHQLLYAATEKGLTTWDVSGDQPQQIEQRTIAGLAGALKWQEKLIAFGSFGLVDLAAPGTPAFHTQPVKSCAVVNGNLAALGSGGLVIFDRDLRVRTLPVRDGHSLAASGPYLLTAGATDLTVHDFRRPRVPVLGGTAPISATQVKDVPLWAGHYGFLAVDAKGGVSVYELSAAGLPSMSVTYQSAPWFLRNPVRGKRFARLAANSTSVDVFRVEGVHMTGLDQKCPCEPAQPADKGRFNPRETSTPVTGLTGS